MQLLIDRQGQIRCVYGESIDLRSLGLLTISRASHIEPAGDGRWAADLSLVQGPTLGPFNQRTEAIAAELAWLESHWLDATGS